MRKRMRQFGWLLGSLVTLLLLQAGDAWTAPVTPVELKMTADHLMKEGETERAVRLYERVLERDRQFANAYYNLATAYYVQGDLWKAILNLEAFLRLQPNDAEALYNLGCLKLRLGDFDEAWKCFLRAENCPCTRLISRKIKEALQFMKDLELQNPETKTFLAYLLTGSVESLSNLPN